MKNILITGGSGLIGQRITQLLEQKGDGSRLVESICKITKIVYLGYFPVNKSMLRRWNGLMQ